MKGLYEQMHNTNKITFPASDADITAAWHELLEQLQQPRPRPKIQLAAWDYPLLSDSEFKALVTNPDYQFIGGSQGCTLFQERCKRLGLL